MNFKALGRSQKTSHFNDHIFRSLDNGKPNHNLSTAQGRIIMEIDFDLTHDVWHTLHLLVDFRFHKNKSCFFFKGASLTKDIDIDWVKCQVAKDANYWKLFTHISQPWSLRTRVAGLRVTYKHFRLDHFTLVTGRFHKALQPYSPNLCFHILATWRRSVPL